MAPRTSISDGLKKPPAKPAAKPVAATRRKVTVETADPFAAPVVAAPGATPEIRPGFKLAKAREVLPHVSLYLHPNVIAKVKEIAAVEGRKAHAVYLDALDGYLQDKHGVSLDGLSDQ